MKRYKLTKANLTRVFGCHNYGVVKWQDNETIIIRRTVYGNGTVPKIYIGQNSYSPTRLEGWIENTDAKYFVKGF
ncbi:hypothetical protein ES705_07496 [subsurface metagenome]|jgi:hypothetical protein|nr:hypothetical protein [Clostridia bacterium]